MKPLVKLSFLVFILFAIFTEGCTNSKANSDKDSTTEVNSSDENRDVIKDKYVGDWVDIAPETESDSNYVYTITKLHDHEYQVGSLKGEIKYRDGSECIVVWVQEYNTEMQLTYDNYTKHLIFKSALFTKELKRK
jgi:hypothetical protein